MVGNHGVFPRWLPPKLATNNDVLFKHSKTAHQELTF